jgi:hypothetical protein
MDPGGSRLDDMVVVQVSDTVERHEDQWILPAVSIPPDWWWGAGPGHISHVGIVSEWTGHHSRLERCPDYHYETQEKALVGGHACVYPA